MTSVVLPTRVIVKEMLAYKDLFDFYPMGVKEFILQHIQFFPSSTEKKERLEQAALVLQKAYLDYLTHVEHSKVFVSEMAMNRLFAKIAPINYNLSEAVAEMMDNIFCGRPYDVWSSGHVWAKDELIIKVDCWHG